MNALQSFDYRDYTKFRLKSEDELTALLDGIPLCDSLLVLACNKCFKHFDADCLTSSEPESDIFVRLAADAGKNVLSVVRLDFLCNEYRLRARLSRLAAEYPQLDSGNCALFIVSCGIGVQTAAGYAFDLMPRLRVYTACDSIESGGGHGMALSEKQCAACGQCFLNYTAGLCPITGCPKNLLNGACGGSKDGKCEVDSDRECVWVNHLTSSSGFSCVSNDFLSHRYNAVSVSLIDAISNNSRKKRLESFYGGVYLRYRKDYTAFLTLRDFPVLPATVTIPMSQHAGTSAEPVVYVGDRVKVGQKIGEATGVISSCVHSSISGIVRDISTHVHPNTNNGSTCITIESDGKNELHNSVIPIPYWEDLDVFDIDAIVAEKGIVGMGGAGFPTPVKLRAPKPIDTILINGCESEPYVTSDHRVMLERADDIITGLHIMLRSTGAKRGIIVISDNKSNAITHLESKTTAFDDIFVMALWSKYPQGAERMLIARTLGRHLNYGQRPYDMGAIVINVSTAAAIGNAFTRGMPLIERAVTVSGEHIKRPGNYNIRIGTPLSVILDYCGLDDHNVTVKMGGPMMGVTVSDFSTPVIKGTNAIIAVDKRISCSSDCIRCGRCVDVCPMELLPLYFPVYAQGILPDDISSKHAQPSLGITGSVPAYDTNVNSLYGNEPSKDARNCIECGACDYICPSGIDIRQAIRKLKKLCLQFN